MDLLPPWILLHLFFWGGHFDQMNLRSDRSEPWGNKLIRFQPEAGTLWNLSSASQTPDRWDKLLQNLRWWNFPKDFCWGCFFLYPKSFAGLSRFFGTVSVVVGHVWIFCLHLCHKLKLWSFLVFKKVKILFRRKPEDSMFSKDWKVLSVAMRRICQFDALGAARLGSLVWEANGEKGAWSLSTSPKAVVVVWILGAQDGDFENMEGPN